VNGDGLAELREGIGTWWPLKRYSVGLERAETAVMEPRVGGPLYERLEGGEESERGRILAWEPGRLVAFSWYPGEPLSHVPGRRHARHSVPSGPPRQRG
jgi:hypothetical protein